MNVAREFPSIPLTLTKWERADEATPYRVAREHSGHSTSTTPPR